MMRKKTNFVDDFNVSKYCITIERVIPYGVNGQISLNGSEVAASLKSDVHVLVSSANSLNVICTR